MEFVTRVHVGREKQVVMMMSTPNGSGGEASADASKKSAPRDINSMSVEQLRAELAALRTREQQIIELIGAKSPDRVMHDLRNLLNEVQLLRILAESGNA
jgi:hypothetical protein